MWPPPEANDWFSELTGILAAGRQLPSPPAGAPGPFSLADPDYARALLEITGFDDLRIDGPNEAMWFGDTTDDAMRFIAGLGALAALLQELEPGTSAAALTNLRDSIETHRNADGVQYRSAMWLITATRTYRSSGGRRLRPRRDCSNPARGWPGSGRGALAAPGRT